MPEIKTLKDGETQVLPRTTIDAVSNDAGQPIQDDIDGIGSEIVNAQNALNNVNGVEMTSVSDNLTELQNIKSALKTSINGSGNLVGDVFADYPGAVDDFRSKVANAIAAKGVATAATDTPDQMATNIGAIKSGGISDTFVNVLIYAASPMGVDFYYLTKDSDGNLIGEITNIPLPGSKNIQVPIGSFLYTKSVSQEVDTDGGEVLVNRSPLNAVLITENTTSISAY